MEPPAVKGKSGVVHEFSYVGDYYGELNAFDVSDSATVIDVLRLHLKRIDTGATPRMVCAAGNAGDAALHLAKEYAIDVIRTEDLDAYFDSLEKKPRTMGSIQRDTGVSKSKMP